MRKKKLTLIVSLFLISIMIGCSNRDKTITMNEDVYIGELENSSKITTKEIDMRLKEGERFDPGFFYEDKIYGILFNELSTDSGENSKNGDFAIETSVVRDIYSAYYSQDEGLVRGKKLNESEAFSEMNYKNRRTYCWKNETFKDTVTDQEKSTPAIKVDFTSDIEGIRVQVANESDNTKGNNNYSKDYIDKKYYDDERAMKDDQYHLVKGNDNYFYRQITNFIYDLNDEGDYSYRNVYSKWDFSYFKSVESMIVLYDYDENKVITFDGNFTGKFPLLSDVMYSKNNNKFYAIGGEQEDEVYEININGDTYSLQLIYKFDLGEKLTRTWNSKIIDNSLLIESFKPEGNEEDFIITEEETLLLDLDSKEIEVINKIKEKNFIIESNSNKYLIFCIYDEEDKKSGIFLGRVRDNKVQYVYEFDYTLSEVIFSEDENKMLVRYDDFKEDGTISYRYVLYNLDIE